MARQPDIHIQRPHALGLPQARRLAQQWMAQAGEKYGLQFETEEGSEGDTVRFERSGIQGTLAVKADQLDLQAELGFLFKAMSGTVEAEIARKIDALLAKSQSA